MQWTEGQKKAREKILSHCETDEIFVLAGYAGTGKTTVVTDVLSQLNFASSACPKCAGFNWSGESCWTCGGSGKVPSIVLCAPTHKAAGVLAEKNTLDHATTSTLASLMGAKPTWNKEKRVFAPNWDKAKWSQFKVIVIDEVSMLGEREWGWILEAQERWPRSVICMGDPAQLPPVKDPDPSPAWAHVEHTLTEVVRHGGPVLEAATRIRDGVDSSKKMVSIEAVDPVIVRQNRDSWLSEAIKRFDSDEDIKILAWTNKSVDWTNARIRGHFFPGAPPMPQAGEKRVVIKTWSHGLQMLYAEQQFTVKSSKEKTVGSMTVWELELENGYVVEEVAPESQGAYREELNALKAACVAKRTPWKQYYALHERFIRSRPAYATTIHKSQGSTYDGVFLVECELKRCRDWKYRNRLHYVGVSRTAGDLWII